MYSLIPIMLCFFSRRINITMLPRVISEYGNCGFFFNLLCKFPTINLCVCVYIYVYKYIYIYIFFFPGKTFCVVLEHNLSCQGLSKSSISATHAKFRLLANLVSIHRILIQDITNTQTRPTQTAV